jgi:hypothetical protein
MNAGNKSRGQADGYQLDALSKTLSIKDPDGNSILKMICAKLYEEDETFGEFKADYPESYGAIKCVIEDLTKDANKAKVEL